MKKTLIIIGILSVVELITILIADEIIRNNFSSWANNLGDFLLFVFIILLSSVITIPLSFILTKISRKNTKWTDEIEIEVKDERNEIIRGKASFKMWYITLLSLYLVLIIFFILQIIVAIWLLLSILIIHIVGYVFLYFKYDKI